jgi:hypothetical protein
MACSILMGSYYPGEKSRHCGFFLDGIYIMKLEIVNRALVVSDPLNRVVYRSEQLGALENYSVQQIGAVRSAQSGRLVACVGGFYAGTDGTQSIVISTDYSINAPVSHEDYVNGQH